jgi:hypothetical protein
MRAAISTLLTEAEDDGIIQSNPRLAKYANVADSRTPSRKAEQRISSSTHSSMNHEAYPFAPTDLNHASAA